MLAGIVVYRPWGTKWIALCRQRRAPVQKDIEAMEEEGPAGELGLDLPEADPMSSRSVTSGNAEDVDTDVVAQQRWLAS